MTELFKTLSLAALVAASGPLAAMAQDTPSETPAPAAKPADEPAQQAADGNAAAPGDLSMGEDAAAAPSGEPGAGQTYVAETFGDWEMRCVKAGDGKDPCQLYQLLEDESGNSVAEMSIFGLPEGQQAAAGATIITPLETLLTKQLTLSVDGGAGKRYPYTFCNQVGCFARVGFTSAEIAQFKKGASATLTIVPAAAPDQAVKLTVSLSGFTAGYDAVNKHNDENGQ